MCSAPLSLRAQYARQWEAGLGGDVGPLSWALPAAEDGSRLRSVHLSYRLENTAVDYRGSVLLLEEQNAREYSSFSNGTLNKSTLRERDRLAAIAIFVDRHLQFSGSTAAITSFGLGVIPWAEGRRVDYSTTPSAAPALITRTATGNLLSVGLGVRGHTWLIDGQLLLVRYDRTQLGSNVLFPITVSRRF